MATKAQLNDLHGDFFRAMRLINEAGNILIDATEAVPTDEIIGHVGPTSSASLISNLAEVSGMIQRGKTVPDTVADKPRLFVTLTAPGFGAIHAQRTTRSGKRIPCGCGAHHLSADTRLGTPVDPEGYDYPGAVLWNAHAGELWHRFTIRLRRELARAAGIRVREFGDHARMTSRTSRWRRITGR
jgi:hypothetical protein